MVDFSSLLKAPAGEAKKPPVLPAGDYPGQIKSYEMGDNNKNKTPYCRFNLGFMGFAPDLDESDTKDIDIAKRSTRNDFYLTEDAMWRLDEFIRTLGIEAAGRSYEEVLRETVGQEVTITMKQGMNQQTNEMYAVCDKVFGPNPAN